MVLKIELMKSPKVFHSHCMASGLVKALGDLFEEKKAVLCGMPTGETLDQKT